MYGIASNLRGFASSSLRVRIVRQDERYVWCVTADLLDAGTKLVLDRQQVRDESAEEVLIHANGLVAFA